MASGVKFIAGAVALAATLLASNLFAQTMPQDFGSGAVEVRGRTLLKDGRPWAPRGYYQIAFEVAPGNLDRADNTFWRTAQDDYNPQEYSNMRMAGADTVRIQIAQAGADPGSPLHDAGFFAKALDAVRAARRTGLTVIVCVQGESHVPHEAPLPLPGEGTRRIWRIIAGEFGGDRGVMFEMLNEPQPVPSPANWAKWRDSMNATARAIREAGGRNVLIADGLGAGQILDGAPLLDDQNVAYASHPYASPQQGGQYGQTRAAWDAKFGGFARRAPVIITEWHFGGFLCNGETPKATLDFLHYIQERGIGVVVGTWDWQPAGFGNARWDFPRSKFSSFAGLSCHQPGYGLGQVIRKYYSTRRVPDAPL